MPLSRSERVLRARLAAYKMHSQNDPKVTTVAARKAFNARFEDEVDPDRTLPEPERLRRAEAARRAHFTRLAFASAKSRRERAGLGPDQQDAVTGNAGTA